MKNKIWITLLLTCLLVAVLPVFARAEAKVVDSGKWADCSLVWTFYDNGTLEITGEGEMHSGEFYPWREYYKEIKNVVIGDGVTSISNGAFYKLFYLKSVTIGKSVKTIGENAFNYCPSLESIHIPAAVEKIKFAAFSDCISLKNLTFAPDSNLQLIGHSAFEATAIQTLELPVHVKEIGSAAFQRCTDLRLIRMNDELESIATNAFRWCNNIRQVYVGKSVKQVGQSVFGAGQSLEYFENNGKVSFDGMNELPNLKTVVIGGEMEVLSGFRDCPNLTNVVITGKVERIDDNAFSGCENLTQIDLPEGLLYIGKGAFCNSGLKGIVLPDSVWGLGGSFYWCKDLAYVICGSGMQIIDNGSFSSCESLEYVDLKNTTELGVNVFSVNPKLTKIIWSHKLEKIGRSAFSDTDNLPAVVIPASITKIDDFAFPYSKIKKFVFLGDAPAFESWGLLWNTEATVYYPADNPTWKQEMMDEHDGWLTWVPICGEHVPVKVSASAASCDKIGWTEGSFCQNCGLTLVEPTAIAPKDHVFEKKTVLPGCDHSGYEQYTCRDCGYSYSDNFQAPLTHAYTKWEAKRNLIQGYDCTRACQDCGYSVYVELEDSYAPAKDPNYERPTPSSTKPSTKPTQSTATQSATSQPTTIPTTTPTTEPTTAPTTVSTTTLSTATDHGGEDELDPLAVQDIKTIGIMLLAMAVLCLTTLGVIIYIRLTKKEDNE